MVRLRKPTQSDAVPRFQLGISREIHILFGGDPDQLTVMTLQHAQDWVDRLMTHPNAWVIEVDGNLVGEIRLDNVQVKDARARLAVGLFSESDLGKRIGRAAIQLVLKYGFEELDLHRIDLRVLAFNTRAIACYEACGFVQEGIERESAFISGKWHDDVIMSILAHEK